MVFGDLRREVGLALPNLSPIYVERCLGLNGREFDLYKLKTMRSGSASREEIPLTKFNGYGKLDGDERVTFVGRFLRRYWVDELPQIINLKRGDIKLVGVRPMSEDGWSRYPRNIMDRALQQKPGLFGVHYALTNPNSFDKDYLDNLEMYLDFSEEDQDHADKVYWNSIINNIVLRGVRSS